MNYKILYVHGLGSGKNSTSAKTIEKLLPPNYQVDAPEIPQNPYEAVKFLESIQNNYDLVMGSSLGGFYTLVLSSHVKKLIVNPAVYPGRYIKEYIGLGEQEYFCERDNGDKSFMIDDDFINSLDDIANYYYKNCLDLEVRVMTRCFTSPEDELLGKDNLDNCIKLLGNNYVTKTYGGHRLSEEIIKTFIVPNIIEMVEHFDTVEEYIG